MSVTQRLRSLAGLRPKTLFLTLGTLAIARISPVRGSITMAVAAVADEPRTVCSSTSSAQYWMSSSSVRRTLSPEVGCVSRTVLSA
jgi:hypothetical protein